MPRPTTARVAVAASAKRTLQEESLIHSTKVGPAERSQHKRGRG